MCERERERECHVSVSVCVCVCVCVCVHSPPVQTIACWIQSRGSTHGIGCTYTFVGAFFFLWDQNVGENQIVFRFIISAFYPLTS